MKPPELPGCDGVQDLLGAYALDAVDPHEVQRVEDHLTTCPRCRQEVDQHRETVALLAAAGGPAPDLVWDRISGAIGEKEQPATAPSPPVLMSPRRRPPRKMRVRLLQTVGLVAAAAVAVVVGLQTVRISDLDHKVNQMSGAVQEAGGGLTAALVDPAARHITLQSTEGGKPVGQLIIRPSGASYLVGSQLPALPSSRTYQLWSMLDGELVSVGLLGSHPVTAAFHVDPAAPAQAYLVTAEPAGGVVVPSGAPVASATA